MYKKAIEEEFKTSIQKVTHLMIVKKHEDNRFKEKVKKVSIGSRSLLNIVGLVTEHIERLFLTIRQRMKCLNRKSLSFSKSNKCLENKMFIFLWNYNYVFYHKTLREKLPDANNTSNYAYKYTHKTPAMKEGLVPKRLTIDYLFHKRIDLSLSP